MNLGDKLKPCPFCGRKMVFIKENNITKSGEKTITQYYIHEDYDISEGDCVLDEIYMPFVIGAGDADEASWYIGEYAKKWNERVE